MTQATPEARALNRARRLEKIAENPDKLCPASHRHGATATCYNGHGCRCDDCRGRRQAARQRPDWEARRLAGKGVEVPAIGAQRRLQALAYNGWSSNAIAERIGSHYRPIMKIRAGERVRVHMKTHVQIVRLFRELALVEAPGHSGRVTRAVAHSAGFVSALAWNNIDDPAEIPEGIGRR